MINIEDILNVNLTEEYNKKVIELSQHWVSDWNRDFIINFNKINAMQICTKSDWPNTIVITFSGPEYCYKRFNSRQEVEDAYHFFHLLLVKSFLINKED